jgi:hypothetical protein
MTYEVVNALLEDAKYLKTMTDEEKAYYSGKEGRRCGRRLRKQTG